MQRLIRGIFIALLVALVAAAAAFGYARGRVVQLGPNDAAVGAGIRCQVNVEAGVPEMLCLGRSRARFNVSMTPTSVIVYKVGSPNDPLYGHTFR